MGLSEYIECELRDGYAEFLASSFSSYGIVSFVGDLDEMVPLSNSTASSRWLWILLGSVAIIGVAIILYYEKANETKSNLIKQNKIYKTDKKRTVFAVLFFL